MAKHKLDDALALAARGFKVFPLKANAKAPPLLHNWPERATTDAEEIKLFWLAMPDANIGVHCDGMIVVDVDVAKGGDESLQLLEITHGLPETYTVRTPSGGRHLYYRAADPVPNSVGSLGAGIDIRSRNGYVVAPGSSTAAGRYVVAVNAPVADAPEWLVLKLGTVVPKTSTTVPVPDAPDANLDLARDWLAKRAPAIQGSGGDLHTVQTALWLRDFGLSEAQALEAMSGAWNEACQPPWPAADLAFKVASAYKSAQNEPGAKVATPEDFPVVVQNVGDSVDIPQQRNALQSLAEFADQSGGDSAYVVKGLLQQRSYAVIYGAPGAGKTFVALDLSYHVAAATPWHNHKIHGGPVLYLAYEGTGGLRKRAKALRQRYGQGSVPLYIHGASYDLRDKPGRQALGALMTALPAKPALIVIDTFAHALMGGDENSAQDVGAFNRAIQALIDNTGACVLLVHHSGKNKAAGARGSSALLGAIDTEIEVDDNQVIARKQRDVEMGAPVGFKLVPVVVGLDADGEELTSCVVEPTTVQKRTPLKGNARAGFGVLCDLSPNNDPVDVEVWKEACGEFLGQRNLAKRFFDIKKKLLDNGIVVVHAAGTVTRRMT